MHARHQTTFYEQQAKTISLAFCVGTDHFKVECDKLFSCFSAQLLIQDFQLRMVAVDVGLIHILEDVVLFVVSALLAGCLTVSYFYLELCYRVNIQRIRAKRLTRVST